MLTGEVVGGRGDKESIWGLSVLFAQIFCKPKTAPKIKSITFLRLSVNTIP